MKKNVQKWILGSLLIAALLMGARSIIRANEAAMGGAGQPAGFYGH
jgi:hypothetical protein